MNIRSFILYSLLKTKNNTVKMSESYGFSMVFRLVGVRDVTTSIPLSGSLGFQKILNGCIRNVGEKIIILIFQQRVSNVQIAFFPYARFFTRVYEFPSVTYPTKWFQIWSSFFTEIPTRTSERPQTEIIFRNIRIYSYFISGKPKRFNSPKVHYKRFSDFYARQKCWYLQLFDLKKTKLCLNS